MPNTIADNLQALNTARLNIADAITNKGGTVNTDKRFSLFPNDINTIPTANLRTLDVTENGTYYESTSTEITSTSFPITLNDSLGTNLLDYLISGNTVQTGTPTPDNPVDVNGVGVRTKNIDDWNTWVNSIDSINGGGSYTATATSISITSGTSTDAYTSPYGAGNPSTYRMAVKPNTTYSVSIDGIGSYQLILWKNGIAASGYGQYFDSARKFATITTDSETTFFTFRAANVGSLGSTATLSNVMIVEGEYTAQTMPTYEPYDYKIPISSASTTTPIYLGEVETTRRIKKLVLTGEEDWFVNEAVSTEDTLYLYTTAISSNTYVPEYSICSHFEYKNAYFICNGNGYHLLSGYGGLRFRVMRTIAATASAFKSYLAAQYAAGTPVTVWYVLATEETGIVNEPLMKIGDYADTVSYEQAGVQIPTNRGNTVIDVMTELKPSEMYIKYDQPSEYAGYNIVNVNVPIPAYINTTIEAVNDSLLESLEGN